MSAMVVVDSCVAYKWLSQGDEGSVEEAKALLDAHESGTAVLAAPATLHVELANALRYSSLEQDDAIALIDEFESFRVELFEPNAERLTHAAALAYRHGLTVYDALFLALAEELRCPLITADRHAFAGVETDVEVRVL